MESNINDIFLELVRDICYFANIDEESICLKVGRNKGYISQLKSRMKAGEDVPVSFVNLLKLHFAEELKKKISDKTTVADAPSVTLAYVIRILAKVNILFNNEAEKAAMMNGLSAEDMLDKMNKAAQDEADSLFEEVRKGSS